MSFKENINKFKQTFDFLKFIRDNFNTQESGDRVYISCPFHYEETPSCEVRDGRYICYGCGEYGDSIDFLSKLYGLSIKEVIESDDYSRYMYRGQYTVRQMRQQKIQCPSAKQVDMYHVALMKKKDKIKYLESRLIDINTIKIAKFGWGKPKEFKTYNSPRYTIPVYDENNRLVTMRYRIDPVYDDGSEPKYLGHPNTNSYLYNSSTLADTDRVLIVGSEFDAAFIDHQLNVPSVGLPGESIFKTEWSKLFINKDVLVWLDNDITGKTGELRIYKELKTSAKNVQLYRWDHGFKKGYDIGDFIKEFGVTYFMQELDKYELEHSN